MWGSLRVSPFSCTSSSQVRSGARLSAIPYKPRQQASREWLLPCSWHSKCAPGFGILLLLQTASQEANVFPFPAGLDGPISWSSYTSARQRCGRRRGIWFQPIPPVWFGNQGHEGLFVHPEVGDEVKPWPSLFIGFINHTHGSIRVGLGSFLRFPRTPSTGLVLRFCS